MFTDSFYVLEKQRDRKTCRSQSFTDARPSINQITDDLPHNDVKMECGNEVYPFHGDVTGGKTYIQIL